MGSDLGILLAETRERGGRGRGRGRLVGLERETGGRGR